MSLYRSFPVSFLTAFLLFCTALIARAETFIVTSTGDSGPGTLREAILQSNANGTTEKDFIYFNLPYATWNERRIFINTSLPEITGGNLVIDGSTQPGSKLDQSDAKLILSRGTPATPTEPRYIIKLNQANDVEIYGIAIIPEYIDIHGIGLENVRRIKIGAPGKGNLLYGLNVGIYSITPGYAENITIQGNMFGVKEDGMTGNRISLDLPNMNGIILGGTGAGEGNHIGDARVSITTTGGKLTVSGNKMGINQMGDREIDVCTVRLEGNATEISFTDNHLGNGSLYVNDLKHPFIIRHNKFGTDASGTQKLESGYKGLAMHITNSTEGLITENIISGYFIGISVGQCFAATISSNEMFCNIFGIDLSWSEDAGRPIPFININSCEASGTGGVATPYSKIELFEPNYCSMPFVTATCQGRRYIATVTADANGKWFYPSTPALGIIATATDPGGATSEYSIAEIDEDASHIIIHPTCGKANGSIKMKVKQGIIIGWKDVHGKLISTNTNLENAPKGDYTFNISNSGCTNETCVTSFPYSLIDLTPTIDATNVAITNTACNQSNGRITNLSVTGNATGATYSWVNELGEEVGTHYDLLNKRPGKYTLTMSINECKVVAGPFEIKSTNAPEIDLSRAIITTATCEQANGSITGITITGTGTISYKWVNVLGAEVGSSPDLQNVPAGTYVLKYSDGSGCSEAETGSISVADKGSITVSMSNMMVTPVGCNDEKGSITGIEAPAATIFSWLNENGETVGTTLNLPNAIPGKYKLFLENAEGCKVNTDFIEVTRLQAISMRATVMVTSPAFCNKDNGTITALTITGGTPASYRWTDESDQLVSTAERPTGLAPGTYKLYVTDAGDCEQHLLSATITKIAAPAIDATNVVITNTTCNLTNGQITNLSFTGNTTNATYSWVNELGEKAGTHYDLLNKHPGKYTLTLSTNEGECKVVAGPFEIKSTPPPAIDLSRVIITSATCKQANGSITGVSITGTGNINYKWVNTKGTIVGTSPDLQNAPAGTYVLKYSDESGCTESETGSFSVADKGSITVSILNMMVTPVGCKDEKGSITGIEAPAATIFSWLNENGQSVSTTLNLQNAIPGKYKLFLENAEGCKANTDYIEVSRRKATGMRAMVMVTSPAFCNENNGAISQLTITGGTPASYRWMNENHQLVSTAERPTGLAPGTYKLYVTDPGGCEQYLLSAAITKTVAPTIDSRNMKLIPDECSRSVGAITGITVTGEQPFSYTWYTGNNIKGQNLALTGITQGEYYLQVTDKYGCKVKSPLYVIGNNDVKPPLPWAESITIVKGMPATITVANPRDSKYYLYLLPGMEVVQSNTTGSFKVDGVSKNTNFVIRSQWGLCLSDFAEVMVKVVDENKVIAPNAFTPNNDGINDLFRIRAYGLFKLEYFTVFNRWGTPVFSTSNPQFGWNGQLNNLPQPPGTYTWIVKGKDTLGNHVQYAGHVLLIR